MDGATNSQGYNKEHIVTNAVQHARILNASASINCFAAYTGIPFHYTSLLCIFVDANKKTH